MRISGKNSPNPSTTTSRTWSVSSGCRTPRTGFITTKQSESASCSPSSSRLPNPVQENDVTDTGDPRVREYRVEISDKELDDLRSRIAATRWPDRETVTDDSQGVPLALMQERARYWATSYDLGRCDAILNGLPNFTTEIDGLDIHFIHARSPHEDALPIIVTHGWPGSVFELLKIVEPLTNPPEGEAAFHLVI